MVVRLRTTDKLLAEVERIYARLDAQIRQHRRLAGQCNVCGKCCDFDIFEHRLFVTLPELVYLAAKLGEKKLKPMTGGRCPYNVEGRCTVYEYRFAGCRIFCCRGDKDFQSALSESTLSSLKSISAEFEIPYLYSGLSDALNNFGATNICR